MRGRYGKTAAIAGKSMAVLPDKTVRTETAQPASQLPFGNPRNQPGHMPMGLNTSHARAHHKSPYQDQMRGRFMLLVNGRSDREVGSASARGGGGGAAADVAGGAGALAFGRRPR